MHKNPNFICSTLEKLPTIKTPTLFGQLLIYEFEIQIIKEEDKEGEKYRNKGHYRVGPASQSSVPLL
jgi:hypothetical protein